MISRGCGTSGPRGYSPFPIPHSSDSTPHSQTETGNEALVLQFTKLVLDKCVVVEVLLFDCSNSCNCEQIQSSCRYTLHKNISQKKVKNLTNYSEALGLFSSFAIQGSCNSCFIPAASSLPKSMHTIRTFALANSTSISGRTGEISHLLQVKVKMLFKLLSIVSAVVGYKVGPW